MMGLLCNTLYNITATFTLSNMKLIALSQPGLQLQILIISSCGVKMTHSYFLVVCQAVQNSFQILQGFNPNQPGSNWIKPDQPVSIRINPYQPVATSSNPSQPTSTCINPSQHVSTRINPYQPVSTCINPYQSEPTRVNQN